MSKQSVLRAEEVDKQVSSPEGPLTILSSINLSIVAGESVAVVGASGAGKSTLLNNLLGEKVAIVSPKPQTTRNRITGIKTSSRSQIVFLDTPGIHQARSLMNRRMVEVALQSLHEVDGVLWLLDSRSSEIAAVER